MSFKSTVFNFFFPQKCPVCRSLLKLGEEGDFVMCPHCRLKWNYEKQKLCSECSLPAHLCVCMPNRMKKAGVSDLFKLCFYDADSGSAADRLVLYMKDYRDRRVFRFVAKELCFHLKKYFQSKNIDAKNVVFTYAPRSRATLEKCGFDQAKWISSECASYMGSCFMMTVKRRYFTKRQKGLNKKERVANANKAFVLDCRTELEGKIVVLVDDVVTTGSSFAACAKLLKDAGTEKIICLAVAQNNRSEKNSAQ